MTIEDQSRDDEMEFDLFLQRKGAVSRGLNAIDQPKSSAALEAAIFAAIEAELEKETKSQVVAANDSAGGSDRPRTGRRISPLWNIPLGLAAGVLLTVLVQKMRHADDSAGLTAQPSQHTLPEKSAEHLDQTAAAVPAIQAEKNAIPPVHGRATPPLAASSAIHTPTPPARKSDAEDKRIDVATNTVQHVNAIAPAPAAIAPMPAPAIVAPMQLASNDSAPVQRVEITGNNIRRVDSETPSPVQVVTAEDLTKSGYTSSDVANVNPRTESDACAPNSKSDVSAQATASQTTATHAAQDPAQAQKCLNLITEKLKAGLNESALDEWEKFHKSFPNSSAPDSMTEEITALQKMKK